MTTCISCACELSSAAEICSSCKKTKMISGEKCKKIYQLTDNDLQNNDLFSMKYTGYLLNQIEDLAKKKYVDMPSSKKKNKLLDKLNYIQKSRQINEYFDQEFEYDIRHTRDINELMNNYANHLNISFEETKKEINEKYDEYFVLLNRKKDILNNITLFLKKHFSNKDILFEKCNVSTDIYNEYMNISNQTMLACNYINKSCYDKIDYIINHLKKTGIYCKFINNFDYNIMTAIDLEKTGTLEQLYVHVKSILNYMIDNKNKYNQRHKIILEKIKTKQNKGPKYKDTC
jgi:hypothetical protein